MTTSRGWGCRPRRSNRASTVASSSDLRRFPEYATRTSPVTPTPMAAKRTRRVRRRRPVRRRDALPPRRLDRATIRFCAEPAVLCPADVALLARVDLDHVARVHEQRHLDDRARL